MSLAKQDEIDKFNAQMKRLDILKHALEAIKKPTGAYNRNKEQYLSNVVDYCIDTADQALKDYAKSFTSGG